MTKVGKINAKIFHFRPSDKELQAWLRDSRFVRSTQHDAMAFFTDHKELSQASTYIVTESPEAHTDQCIPIEEANNLVAQQDKALESLEMICVDGVLGNDPKSKVGVRYIVPVSHAHLAAMFRVLFMTVLESGSDLNWQPDVVIVHTPDVAAKHYPDQRIILLDLESQGARLLHTDSFDDARGTMLRLWTKIIYDLGGLPLHAATKWVTVPNEEERRPVVIVGRERSGKSRLLFDLVEGEEPLSNDYAALFTDGTISIPEKGLVVATNGLRESVQPRLFEGVMKPTSFLLNVSVDEKGNVDFGREDEKQRQFAIVPRENLGLADFEEGQKLPAPVLFAVLFQCESICPAIFMPKPNRAVRYFMFAERVLTSGRGRSASTTVDRLVGGNPYFPLLHAMQANRLKEIMTIIDFPFVVLNTGQVGGADKKTSVQVKPEDTSTCLRAMIREAIDWEVDKAFDFVYAKSLRHASREVDPNLLNPRLLYESQDRLEEYTEHVATLQSERQEYLERFPGLSPRIITPDDAAT